MILATGGEARLELGAGVLEPAHLYQQRAGSLDQRRVAGFRFRRPVRLCLHLLARVEEAALRAIQLVVGLALVRFNPGDRLLRLFLSRILRPLLVLRRAALDGNLFPLPRDPLRCLAGRSDLQIEAEHGLFLAMLLALQQRGCGLGAGDAQVDRGELLPHAFDGSALVIGALAQLLDFALGREDALCLGAHATLDDVETAEDVAVERHDGPWNGARGIAGRIEVRRNPGVREHRADHVGDRTRHLDDVGERGQPWWHFNRCR